MMSTHLTRQIDHWNAAIHRLAQPEVMAAPAAWAQLESHTGTALRSRLNASLRSLREKAEDLLRQSRRGDTSPEELRQALQEVRKDYLRTEITLDYFGDAINTRTNSRTGGHLMALDYIASEAMRQALQPLGHLVPPVMTYLDKGLGASILKAGLRLWDQRGVNPVAVIKVVRHNLYRPTALIHEAGHQISYILNWNKELGQALETGMSEFGHSTARTWGSWSSEIAADAYAFIFTGYAAVATLQDVLSGSNRLVFQYRGGDPHPIPYLRTLLGIAMCRREFGAGPWDDLESYWMEAYPLSSASPSLRPLLQNAREQAQVAADIILAIRMRAFGGQSLTQLLPTKRLLPSRLLRWGAQQGPPENWPEASLKTETLDLLALSIYQQVTESEQSHRFRREMDGWFQRLGNQINYSSNQPLLIHL